MAFVLCPRRRPPADWREGVGRRAASGASGQSGADGRPSEPSGRAVGQERVRMDSLEEKRVVTRMVP